MRWLICGLLTAALASAELTAEQVLVLCNRTEPASRAVADHYLAARGVPVENLLELDLPTDDTISRQVYLEQVLPAVRAALADPARNGKIRCLLLVYGLPLRIANRPPTPAQEVDIARLKPAVETAKAALETVQARAKDLRATKELTEAETVELAGLNDRLPELRRQHDATAQELARAQGKETGSSLDSELALLAWPDYETYRWVLNPLHFAMPPQLAAQTPPVALTARLDGPTAEVAMRLVDDAIATERDGLTGKVYLDARGRKLSNDWFGYGGYDESIRDLAQLLEEKTELEVVLENTEQLFQPGDCPDAAFYCGWYSLRKYIDAFDWNRGAIAYHIASFEAQSLHADSEQWCRSLLADNVTATLGPVAEPYTIAFPKPFEFFTLLLTGKYTLAEVWGRTNLLNSWMITLLGDPLYNPYRDRPVLDESELRPSPLGTKLPWERE